MKSRSSLLALAHPGDPGKRAVKRLWVCGGIFERRRANDWNLSTFSHVLYVVFFKKSHVENWCGERALTLQIHCFISLVT